MKLVRFYGILFAVLACLLACSKDKDEVKPLDSLKVYDHLEGTIWVQQLPARDELPEDYAKAPWLVYQGQPDIWLDKPFIRLRVLSFEGGKCTITEMDSTNRLDSQTVASSVYTYWLNAQKQFVVGREGLTNGPQWEFFWFAMSGNGNEIFLIHTERTLPLRSLDRNIPFVRATWENGLLQAYIKGEITYR